MYNYGTAPTSIRACYAMPGTDTVYKLFPYAISGTAIAYGTATCYGPTRLLRGVQYELMLCAYADTRPTRPPRHPEVVFPGPYRPTRCYAMSGTHIAYGPAAGTSPRDVRTSALQTTRTTTWYAPLPPYAPATRSPVLTQRMVVSAYATLCTDMAYVIISAYAVSDTKLAYAATSSSGSSPRRCAVTEVHRHRHTDTETDAQTQTHRHTDTQTHRHTDAQVSYA
eukprot:1471768-Rhodomonas_salina.3